MKKSRILVLVGSAKSIHVYQWSCNLSSNFDRVFVFTLHPSAEFKYPANVTVLALPNFVGLGYLFCLFPYFLVMLFLRPSVVNIHYASGYGSFARVSKIFPVVLNVWGSDVFEFPRKSIFHRAWLGGNIRASKVVASTSHAMAREVMQLYGDSLSNVEITPFGVDVEKFAPREKNYGGPKVVIGTVKTLHEKYGIDFLIRAFAMFVGKEFSSVAEAEAYVTLRLVGGGDKAALVSLCQQLGIVDIVEFVGAVPHSAVPSELSLLDIYCAPSRQESFGVAVIEASSCGVPVIVSDAGGLPEVVVHGQTGFITPVGDIEAICAAMQRLYHDRSLRETMGKNGRDFVVKNYSWQVCTQKMLNTYKKAIES